MEERRLNTLISHLSLCSNRPPSDETENLKRTEKSGVAIPDITQGNSQHFVKEQKAFRFITNSNILESRQSRFSEETYMRGDGLYPTTPASQGAGAQLKEASQCRSIDCMSASSKGITRNPSPKEQTSHSFSPYSEATKHKCKCLPRPRFHFSEAQGNCPCLQMNDQGVKLRTSVQGDGLDNTGQTTSQASQMQNISAAEFEHVCSICDAKIHELEAQRKSLNSGKVLVDSFQGGEDAHHRLCVAVDREAQTPRSLLEQNLMTCRDVLDSQSVKSGMDTSGSSTLSRNNAMTGQRRHNVDDCIFCLIIQGLSPAFKLYEDEMCVCILDVHPLAHGHSLLIPKAHFPSLELTPPEVAAAMCATVPFISMAIMQATNCVV